MRSFLGVSATYLQLAFFFWGSSPLYFVQAEILDLLARKGANLNARTSTGVTLAHVTARDGHSGCLRVLCERGADVDAVNQLGNTPIMFAAMAGDVDVSFVTFCFLPVFDFWLDKASTSLSTVLLQIVLIRVRTLHWVYMLFPPRFTR